MTECPCSGKTLARIIQPAVMAVLAKETLHGYLIVQRLSKLAMFQDQTPDPAGLYRLLKAMEHDGLVVSTWDMDGAGPAKRRYKLTSSGRKCLARWAGTLTEYRDAITDLLNVVKRSSPKPRR
jgi:DNA-binding PadR family transcriptional regulator